ncbi:sulfite exporter TauE/SafE family protein [Candidatus Woesearchaeota archaeon]|nr:sulfite exporter TauE/SafE family protein [Candidatus Woesearchaeota archaeon]
MAFIELLLIFAAGIIGGVYGTLVGAGNVLTIPLMIFLGIPVHETIAANRFGTIGLVGTGYYKFQKKKLVNHKIGLFIAFFAAIGSYFGTKLVLSVDARILEKIISIVIIALLSLTLFNKNIGLEAKRVGKRHMLMGSFASLLLGAYIGFMGLAAGTFLIYLAVMVFGQTFLQSAGTIKIPGGIASLISAIIFWLNGKIIWSFAIVLFASYSIGSYIGAHYSDRIGNVWLRRMFIAVSAVMALTLLF